MAKSREQVKKLIQKLFAVTDPTAHASEAEIQTALAKAKRLMYEYKLTESDFLDKEKFEVIKRMLNIKFSTTVNPWILTLNQIIADNFCCHSVVYTSYHSKQKNVGLIGFESDLEMAEKSMIFAVDCAFAEFKRIESKMRKAGHSYAEMSAAKNAWGNGFARGIREKFEEQQKQEEESFAMVMVEPQEVKDVASGLHRSRFDSSKANYRARQFDEYAVAGFTAGKAFSMNDKLAG